MIIYMFQCHSSKPSHPHPLPQSPKDCSIHLCLFCCLAYRIIITIFLKIPYICISMLYWCFSFWLTSLCLIGSSFIHFIRTDQRIFFYSVVVDVSSNSFHWIKPFTSSLASFHLFHSQVPEPSS